MTAKRPEDTSGCPVCGFLESDGSSVLGYGTAAIASDRSWQTAQLGEILAIMDRQMVELLYAPIDRPWLCRPDRGSDQIGQPLFALEGRLLTRGYYAGRVVLQTAADVLHWPEPPLSDLWRDFILEHRSHPRGVYFRSMGATSHVQQLLRLEGLEPVHELVDLCKGVLRVAFGDAIAEGMLANPNLADAF